MKKTLLYILLPPIISLLIYLYYEGILNPKKIVIDKMLIATPKYYNLLFGAKNYEKMNIKCKKNLLCSKKFTIKQDKDIILLNYHKIFSNKVLGISVQNLRYKEIDENIFRSKKYKKIGKCVFKQKYHKKYEYIIYKKDKPFTRKINIIADENNVAQQILTELCN